MKIYEQPTIALIPLADENILTISDPGVDDPGWDDLTL